MAHRAAVDASSWNVIVRDLDKVSCGTMITVVIVSGTTYLILS
jgi:hypothetical protein